MEKGTAVLVIDMQDDFLSPQSQLYFREAAAILPAIERLLAISRAKGWQIIHIIREHDPSGADIEKFRLAKFVQKPFCVTGTKGAEEPGEIAPQAGDIVVGKTRFSGFFATKLDLILRRLGVKRLVLCGAQYPNCIRATAVDGMACDYDVDICPEATWGASKKVVEANIFDMRNMGIGFPSLNELSERN